MLIKTTDGLKQILCEHKLYIMLENVRKLNLLHLYIDRHLTYQGHIMCSAAAYQYGVVNKSHANFTQAYKLYVFAIYI